MTDKHRNTETIFHEAGKIADPEERAAYLTKACGADAALRARIDKLLAAKPAMGGFLQDETQESPDSRSAGSPVHVTTTSASLSGQPGAVIDRYKLLEQIGEGGFGVVYMAEQEKPVRRRVALKIIKLGMDTKQVIARFEAERQALAMMDHPHIAKVLDAGTTDTGRPYFVMELVKGIRITEYCDKKSMSLRERLNLFVQVCGAVQHAHQKGAIHRDIKPSNVLVTHGDHKPAAKVIDFGIAKATEQRLTEQTMFTEFGQFIGTPAYMSPEQADPIGIDIDTRSDIYSLGVLLYELLTGVTPFDIKTLRGAALDEIKRIIREEEPSKPSTRLSSLGEELEAVSRQRGSEPKKLGTILRGDLDWIIMKALEKDRTRRYETANGLAMDVERYLGDEPVLASPPSATYRLQKLIRRNKGAFAVAAVIAFLLLGGITGTTLGLTRARRAEAIAILEAKSARLAQDAEANERGRAEKEAERARTEAAKSNQVAEFMQAILEGVGPSVARGRDTIMLREILDRTAERLGEELGDQSPPAACNRTDPPISLKRRTSKEVTTRPPYSDRGNTSAHAVRPGITGRAQLSPSTAVNPTDHSTLLLLRYLNLAKPRCDE